MCYIGRFAPSPSGPLHFGSLVTALGSYLQAKANHGKWLVRIEDIDPPREVKGAATSILKTLDALQLHWDDNVLFQSACSARYLAMIDDLLKKHLAYYCDCTRQRIQSLPSGCYDAYCRERKLAPNNPAKAIRLRQTQAVNHFTDRIRGHQQIALIHAQEDFIIHRKDNLFAYNFVVVLDDYYQKITEIVRGADLLPVTTKQISLYKHFNWPIPSYCHLPLALDVNGKKLSKQNHARPIDLGQLTSLTVDALRFLGQVIPDDWQDANQTQLINWAITHWDITQVPQCDKTQSPTDMR